MSARRWVRGAVPLVAALSVVLGAAAANARARVDVERRADVPWSVAVLAVPSGRAAPMCTTGALAALVARGARCEGRAAPYGTLVVVEGPPALERDLVAALSAHEGAVFAELHAALNDAGARGGASAPLPSAPLPSAPGPSGARTTSNALARAPLSLRLSPSASLFGLEGAALALVLQDALQEQSRGARVTLDAEGARLWIEPAAAGDDAARAVRSAVERLSTRQPAPVAAERLAQRARGVIAARDATVGARAAARARAWLATGSAALDSAADGDGALLVARVRARVFGAALSQHAPAPPVPGLSPPPAPLSADAAARAPAASAPAQRAP